MNLSLILLDLLDQLVLINDPFSAPDMDKMYDVITDYLLRHTQKEPNFISAVSFCFQKVSYTIGNPAKTLKKITITTRLPAILFLSIKQRS